MSGLIGSAGGRSGVIGTTELDYEEGLWIPADGQGTSVSYTSGNCNYTKIGNFCFVRLRINPSTWSAGVSYPYIWGLPFVPNSSSIHEGHAGWEIFYSGSTNTSGWSPGNSSSDTFVYFHQLSGTTNQVSTGSFRGLTDIIISGCYTT